MVAVRSLAEPYRHLALTSPGAAAHTVPPAVGVFQNALPGRGVLRICLELMGIRLPTQGDPIAVVEHTYGGKGRFGSRADLKLFLLHKKPSVDSSNKNPPIVVAITSKSLGRRIDCYQQSQLFRRSEAPYCRLVGPGSHLFRKPTANPMRHCTSTVWRLLVAAAGEGTDGVSHGLGLFRGHGVTSVLQYLDLHPITQHALEHAREAAGRHRIGLTL